MSYNYDYHALAGKKLQQWCVGHFTAHELAPVGRRHGSGVVLQKPPSHLLENALPTVLRLECVRKKLGGRIRVLSGYRDSEYNRAVGGSSESLHMKFNAFDVTPLDHSLEALYDEIMKVPGVDSQCGVGLYESRNFIHFDTRVLVGLRDRPWHEIFP